MPGCAATADARADPDEQARHHQPEWRQFDRGQRRRNLGQDRRSDEEADPCPGGQTEEEQDPPEFLAAPHGIDPAGDIGNAGGPAVDDPEERRRNPYEEATEGG